MTRLERYTAFWNERESPEALALLRITVGLAVLAHLFEPVVTGTLLERYAGTAWGGVFAHPANAYSLFRWIPPTATAVVAVEIAQLLGALMITAGFFPRLGAAVCVVGQIAFCDRLGHFSMGADGIYRVFLFLMMLAPSGAALSLDASLRGKGAETVPKWPRRLFIAQLALIYVRTGMTKTGDTWGPGSGFSAVYYAMNYPVLARWPGGWAARVYPLTQVATAVSRMFEITFFMVPLNLYFRRAPERGGVLRRAIASVDLRLPYLALFAVMHLVLLITLSIGFFSIIMVSVYPCFLEPREVRLLIERGTQLAREAGLLEREAPPPAQDPSPSP